MISILQFVFSSFSLFHSKKTQITQNLKSNPKNVFYNIIITPTKKLITQNGKKIVNNNIFCEEVE